MSTDLIIGLTVGIGGFILLCGLGYKMEQSENNYNYDNDDTGYNARVARESNISRNMISDAFNRGNKDKYYNETPDEIRVGGRKSKKSRKSRKSRK